MKPLTAFILGVLVVAVAVLGYLYYDESKNDIEVQIGPSKLSIDKK